MATRNVEVVRGAHESWNRRDFNGIARDMADNIEYVDRARNLTLNKQQFIEWTRTWATAFPDARIVRANYIDAGDTVVAELTVEGTNNGPFAGMPPTGRRVSFTFCEVTRLDSSGHSISGSGYYDLYTILTQLGHIQPLAAAA